MLNFLPNTNKLIISKWPKFLNDVPMWRNFAKSGHTAVLVVIVDSGGGGGQSAQRNATHTTSRHDGCVVVVVAARACFYINETEERRERKEGGREREVEPVSLNMRRTMAHGEGEAGDGFDHKERK